MQFDGQNLGLGVVPDAWTIRAIQLDSIAISNTVAAGGGLITQNAVYTATGWKYRVNGPALSLALGNAGVFNFGGAAAGVAGNPITFVGGVQIDAVNSTISAILPTGGLGFTTGAGGSQAQGVSRTTGVTLNTPTGAITLFSTTALALAVTTFTVTNSRIRSTDTVILNQQTGAGVYILAVTNVANGSFAISVFTPVAVVVAEAPIINFNIIRGVTT